MTQTQSVVPSSNCAIGHSSKSCPFAFTIWPQLLHVLLFEKSFLSFGLLIGTRGGWTWSRAINFCWAGSHSWLWFQCKVLACFVSVSETESWLFWTSWLLWGIATRHPIIPKYPLNSGELSVYRVFTRFLPVSTMQAIYSTAELYSTL